MTRLALDSSALIYLVEGSDSLRGQLEQRIAASLALPSGSVMASRLARMECRVKPQREANLALLEHYEALFESEEFVWVEVSESVLDRATNLRATHGFKTPDAINLASAIEARADVFLTGDSGLAKCPGILVEVYKP